MIDKKILATMGATGGVIKSVEYVELTFGSTATTVSADLTKGQDEIKCTPFYSYRSTGSWADNNQYRQFHLTFDDNGGTARLNAVRDAATSHAGIVGVFVVEWGAAINVQQVSVTSFTGLSITPALTSVGAQADAFMMFSYEIGSVAADDLNDGAVQARFDGASVTQASLTRRASADTITGTLYVVDCDASEWTVQHKELTTLSTETIDTAIITPVVTADTFLIHSYETSETSDAMFDGAWIAQLSASTSVAVRRRISGTPGSTSTHSIAVVECNDNQWDVQRNNSFTLDATTITDSITAIDQDRSIAQSLHGYGFISVGRNDSVSGDDIDDVVSLVDFSSDSLIRFKRRLNTLDTRVNYEVIQFA